MTEAKFGRITSHVLDLSEGRPVVNIEAHLYKQDTSANNNWVLLSKNATNSDGRMVLIEKLQEEGIYKLIFESGKYYAERKLDTFYPQIAFEVNIKNAQQNYHIPLLLAQYGYSTYRGS